MTFQEKLKNETKINHDAAEQHTFNELLLKGELSDQKYYLYLKNIVPVYDYIEKRLGFTGELIRSTLIYNDISAYAKFGCTNGPSNYFVYDWMNTLAQKSDKLLLSEVYVEWLKDLYGGQIIGKNVRYNSHLKFNDAKSAIGIVRAKLASIMPDDEKDFVFEVNRTYINHYNLYDSIMFGEK
jgi:heme oxygenase